ncbi:epimerase [candidate division LCP-89 bacterium B3_LCP]|uniref:GDP-L-fucose synthase n=1 Tax=candidate division LCP-89 bacterium B3_LCP TaxID=2012998 RepID=A0A532UUQ0_UNCL8|nr:MAG: epimerase [candidate division LCP-89 bacterium B3_LCP]
MSFWRDKRVVVTGGAGFVGSHVVDILKQNGAEVFVPRKRDFDLMKLEDGLRCFLDAKPDMVIHGAAYYGGIWINQVHPGKIYYENLIMGANVIEACRLAGIEKFVGVGTACSYPGYLEGNLSEENLWDGPLHDSVRNYGLTKKMMQVQCWAYKKQYDFNGTHLILTNLYGPLDSYNEQRSHVVAALIRKFVEATLEDKLEVEVWGTGKPVREFLFVEDCAEAIVRAAEIYNDVEPLNIGTGIGTSIRELVELVQDISGFRGELHWNTDKPDGQMVKILNVNKMQGTLNWKPPTDLRTGLEKTIKWYRENKQEADARF